VQLVLKSTSCHCTINWSCLLPLKNLQSDLCGAGFQVYFRGQHGLWCSFHVCAEY
jgi:hypothetical protein